MQIKLGKKTTNIISKINKINGWQNRAVYGTVALASQPFFDYKNPNVDETTQKYSLTRTLIKIAVGTSVGIASRAAFQRWGQNLYKKGVFNAQTSMLKNINNERFKNCIGNVFSIIGSVTAIFTIDMLISNMLLNHFNKKIKNKEVKQ